MFFLVPFDLVDRRGLAPTSAGLAFLPFTLGVGLLSRPCWKLDAGSASVLGGPHPNATKIRSQDSDAYLVDCGEPALWIAGNTSTPNTRLAAPRGTVVAAQTDHGLEGSLIGI